MTLKRLEELISDTARVRELPPWELDALLAAARVGAQLGASPDPVIHNHPLHLLVGKIPDFDLGWTSQQKLDWFDGMGKLLQAAS